jgi:cytochrome d ubiquinol oxidase subunit I
MQTPAGFEMVDGRFQPKDWLAIIFNPSFPYRFAHVVTAVYITTGFVVVGVAGWWLLNRRFYQEARTMLSMTLWLLTVLVPLQALIGDQHGLDTRKYQPAKLAGIEAIWDGGRRLPWVVFAIPDDAAARNFYEISIPLLGSLILTHDPDGEVRGLKDFPPEDRPPVPVPFFGFRIMLACWGLMFLTVILSWWLRFRGELYDADWYHRVCVFAAPLGFIAVIAGWATTEVGRQPWTVYGLLRTADSVSPSLTGADVAVSLLGYTVVYLVMFAAGVAMMVRIFGRGPTAAETPDFIEGGRPIAPVNALPRAGSEG